MMNKPEKPPERRIKDIEQETMFQLLGDNKLLKKILEIEKEYPYWDEFKLKTKGYEVDSKLLWKLVKLLRERNTSRILVSNVSGFNFKYYMSGITLNRLHKFDLNLGGKLETGTLVPENDKDRYLIGSLMEEAIASSQLEGAATTREVAKLMLRSKRKPKDHSEKMIINNYNTIKEIVTLKNEKLTPDLIKHVHSIISKGTLDDPDNEGVFRNHDKINIADETGEVFHYPPSHTSLNQLMTDFCNFANYQNDNEFTHPIIKGIILHFLIGYIHPFIDGNGRTARAIFYWFLVKSGYWLIEFLSISKIIKTSPGQYAKAYLYTEYDENDLTYFIDFNLKCMDNALINLEEYIKRKTSEKKSLYNIIKKIDVNERQAEVIKHFINYPEMVITINEVQSDFGTAYQTARTDLMKLESMGYLKSKFVGKKLIYFKSNDFYKHIKKIYIP